MRGDNFTVLRGRREYACKAKYGLGTIKVSYFCRYDRDMMVYICCLLFVGYLAIVLHTFLLVFWRTFFFFFLFCIVDVFITLNYWCSFGLRVYFIMFVRLPTITYLFFFFFFFKLHGVIFAVIFAVIFVTYFNLQYDVFRFIRQ
jgi:hypothetical protein